MKLTRFIKTVDAIEADSTLTPEQRALGITLQARNYVTAHWLDADGLIVLPATLDDHDNLVTKVQSTLGKVQP